MTNSTLQAPLLRLNCFWRALAGIATLIFFAAAAAAQLPTPTLVPYTYAPYAANPGYIRAGAPILITGRMLQADATGTLTFAIDGVPAQTSTLAAQSFSDYIALGDSITAADYIGNPAQRYQAIVAADLNLIPAWYASPGMTSCDNLTDFVIPNGLGLQTTSTPLYSVLLGNNDRVYFGVGAGEQYFEGCHQAMLAWIGTPAAAKVIPGSPGIAVQSGTWITGPPFGQCCFNVNVLTNSTGSGTVRFTLTTTGNAAYLWYQTQIASPGSFTVSVDGAPSGAPISTSFPANSSGFDIPGSYALLRLPVSAGTHTFDIAAQGGAQSGTVGLLGMGSMPSAGQKATILVGDVPNEQLQANAAGIAEYTADIKADIALLTPDGLDLRFVPTQQYMFATPAEMMDNAHPNQLGLSEIAQAFTAAVTPFTPAADTVILPSASFQSSSIPIGGHAIAILYSGDGHYAPTSAGEFSMVIYDGTSSVSLTSDAAIYTTQSPITLTASVPTANASGMVTFFDLGGATPVQLGSAWLQLGNTASLVVPSLTAGQHTLMALYAGDIHYNGSSSETVAITVSGSATSTSLTAPNTRYDSGSAVLLTAAVSPATATGSITFSDGATVLAQVPLTSGSATFSTSSLATGIHSLTAAYSGTSQWNSSVSPVLAIEVDPNPTVTAIAPPPASIAYGAALTLSAGVSPAAATGTLAFSDGTQSLGQTTIVNGVATLNLLTLAPGNHTFTALYSGDTDDLPSVSAAVATQVTLDASATTLAPIPASITVGTAIALSASVTPAASTGTITFTDSISGTLAQAAVVHGSATASSASLAPGVHRISASYSGDSFRTPSGSAAFTVTVLPVTSSIVLAPPAATVYLGNPLSLSASITPASATGTVTFRDANLGMLGQSAVTHGYASLTLPNPTLGSYNITASYSGDTNDTAATSNTVATQIALNPTSLALTSSSNPAPVATPVTLLATLSPASATGTITFFEGNSAIGAGIVSNGKASFTTSTLAPGSQTLRATYSGDPLDAASASATFTQTVNSNASTTSLSLAQTGVVVGATITFNVRVADAFATPTGTVSIRTGATTLVSAPLANASAGAGYATLSISSTTLGIGTFPVVAFYSGDTDDQSSDSSATPVSVTVTSIPTTATLTLSSAQIPILGATTITVSMASATAVPTGSIAFLGNGTTLATTQLNSAGAASYYLSENAMGTYAITAAYTPAGVFAAASIAPATLLVTAPLSATVNPTSINADPGTTVSVNLAILPLSGFTGAIQTVCQTTVAFVACSLNAPADITGPTTTPVQIKVSQSDAALATPAHRGAFAITLACMLPLLTLRRSKRVLSLLCLLLASLYMSGCADGGNFNSIPAGAQTVAVTITAAGVACTTDITVNVQQ